MLTEHRQRWDTAISQFTKNSIETRQAMIIGKIEELQTKKKRLERLLDQRHSRSTKSLDLDARIKASASQNYFIVADHLQKISRSLERDESIQQELKKTVCVQRFVKNKAEEIESRCQIFDSRVHKFVSEYVLKKEQEKEQILKRAEVVRRKSLGKLN